jgi:predicted Zn-dependent protease
VKRWPVFALLVAAAGCGAGKIVGTGLYMAGVVDKHGADAIGASDNLTNAMKPIGFEEEKSIGGAVALVAVSRFGGLDPDVKLQRYVATVGQVVAAYSDRAAIPYHFAVLASKEPNAFACPGGYIFVTRGLVDLVDDESELAGVLGHEIAHVSEKHALGIIRRSKMIAGTAEVTAAYLDANPAVFDKLVDETTKTILDKGIDKSKELDADRIGMDFARRLGYDATGLKRFLEKLHAHEDKAVSLKATHPPAEERIAELEKILEKTKPAAGQVLVDRFRTRVARQGS